jgi:hypothetical protein
MENKPAVEEVGMTNRILKFLTAGPRFYGPILSSMLLENTVLWWVVNEYTEE